MALWPFGKKNRKTETDSQTDSVDSGTTEGTYSSDSSGSSDSVTTSGDHVESDGNLAEVAEYGSTGADDALAAGEEGAAGVRVQRGASGRIDGDGAPAVIEHDAVNGETGPFDGDTVEITDFDFSDFAEGMLNLGSIQLPLPKHSQVQVEMGEQGPRMLHIITEHGRITPVAFASPNSGGMWDESSREIADGMETEGMPVKFETGPWGREVVGTGENGIIRVIGVEGPRWLYRVTLAAPHGKEDELADLTREIIARSFVYRGSEPVLAGNSLPVELPAALAVQIQQAMQQQAQQDQQPGSGQ